MIDYIIIGVVLVIMFFAIRKIINNKKKGSCCGCSGCEKSESCGTQK